MDVMASEMMDRSLRRPGYRALVVDDEAALAEVVASYLEREQFEALVIGDGARGFLEIAVTSPCRPSSDRDGIPPITT